MKIQVTQEHIKRGLHRDACRCPVALAIKALTQSKSVSVDRNSISVEGKHLTTPVEVRQFVRSYDAFAPVHPFEFELPIEEAA